MREMVEEYGISICFIVVGIATIKGFWELIFLLT